VRREDFLPRPTTKEWGETEERFLRKEISHIKPLNLPGRVGRVTPCAPGLGPEYVGAHGVRLSQNLVFGGTSYTSP